jgi:hypothetical protein
LFVWPHRRRQILVSGNKNLKRPLASFAAREGDSEGLEAGLLSLSNGGILFVDGLERVSKQNLSILSNGGILFFLLLLILFNVFFFLSFFSFW